MAVSCFAILREGTGWDGIFDGNRAPIEYTRPHIWNTPDGTTMILRLELARCSNAQIDEIVCRLVEKWSVSEAEVLTSIASDGTVAIAMENVAAFGEFPVND